MSSYKAGDWHDNADSLEAYELAVRWSKKDDARHVAHVTVPYDRSNNRKLYIKIALTATWLRRVFADRAFSIRRARDVANATEIMSDKATVLDAVSIIEEFCRFHAHDSTSPRLFASDCVLELPPCEANFDLLKADAEGTLFVVRMGRLSNTKVHVYAGGGGEQSAAPRVVVLGAAADAANVASVFNAMHEKASTGESHDAARAWALEALAGMYAHLEQDDDGASCLDQTALTLISEDLGDSGETSYDARQHVRVLGAPGVTLVHRHRSDEVESWVEEKRRLAGSKNESNGGWSVKSPTRHTSGGGALAQRGRASYASIAAALAHTVPSAAAVNDGSPPRVVDALPVERNHISSTPPPTHRGSAASLPVSPKSSDGRASSEATHKSPERNLAASTTRTMANQQFQPTPTGVNSFASQPQQALNQFGSAPFVPSFGAHFVSQHGSLGGGHAVLCLCRVCGVYPRRVAMNPCNHLALCLMCNDLNKRANAPCPVCGSPVMQRHMFYLD
jgi:hypothetical protein